MKAMTEAEWLAMDPDAKFTLVCCNRVQAYIWESDDDAQPTPVEIVSDEPGPGWDTSL